MSTQDPTSDTSLQVRLDERKRCIAIVEAQMPGQTPLVQALLRRILNLIAVDDDDAECEPDSE